MSNLHTSDPLALQALMNEALFDVQDASVRIQEEASTVISPVEDRKEAFVFDGNKDKGILFILRYQEYPYFSPEAQDAFVKILEATKIKKEEVALVNLAHPDNPNDFKMIMEYFSPTKIILLGVEPKSLKLPEIEHNSYMKGRIAVVFNTFSFEEMFDNVEKKRAFWGEFKNFMQA